MTSIATLNPHQNYARDHCAACGDMLSGSFFALPERPERYCANCIASRPRCDVCSAPLADAHWQLHDRRRLCAMCHATEPGWAGMLWPPKGVLLETPAQVALEARRIYLQAGVTHAMPPANLSYIEPQERAAIIRWFRGAGGEAL